MFVGVFGAQPCRLQRSEIIIQLLDCLFAVTQVAHIGNNLVCSWHQADGRNGKNSQAVYHITLTNQDHKNSGQDDNTNNQQLQDVTREHLHDGNIGVHFCGSHGTVCNLIMEVILTAQHTCLFNAAYTLPDRADHVIVSFNKLFSRAIKLAPYKLIVKHTKAGEHNKGG